MNRIQPYLCIPRLGRLFIFLTILVGFFFSACSKITLPPLASPSTGIRHTGKFVRIDLLTEDVQRAKEFYSGLFGWTFESLDRPPLPRDLVAASVQLFLRLYQDYRHIPIGVIYPDNASRTGCSAHATPGEECVHNGRQAVVTHEQGMESAVLDAR